jgi:hypothetical protein
MSLCILFDTEYLGPKPNLNGVEWKQTQTPSYVRFQDHYYPYLLPQVLRRQVTISCENEKLTESIVNALVEWCEFERVNAKVVSWTGFIIHPYPLENMNDRGQYCECCYHYIVVHNTKGEWFCNYCIDTTEQWCHDTNLCVHAIKSH